MKNHSTHYDVIILGAGASGLFCAFTAAKRGLRVLALEKANKIGKKILMSGGGRCNFTNHFIEADNFISENPHFCKAALKRFTQWDFITMVEQYGIKYEERNHSQLFCQHSASEILNMLLNECEINGAEIKTHCSIDTIESLALKESSKKRQQKDPRYKVKLHQDGNPVTFSCHSLVVATGALSIPTLGGSGIGYELAKQFELPITECRAGLVPFMFSDSVKVMCERLSGLSVEVVMSCNGQSFTENILFTHRGISGPAALQMSNYWHPGDTISINLLPDLSALELLLTAKQQQGKTLLKTLLNQHLAKPLVKELQQLWWPESANTALAEFTDKQLTTIGNTLNNWPIKPSSTEGYRTAEVTLGGVNTASISSKTMETKQQPGLYFIGEVLDVSGQLGGFNFQWAWSSGYSAGLFV